MSSSPGNFTGFCELRGKGGRFPLMAGKVAISIRGLVSRQFISSIALEYNKAIAAERRGTAAKLHLTGLELGISKANIARKKANVEVEPIGPQRLITQLPLSVMILFTKLCEYICQWRLWVLNIVSVGPRQGDNFYNYGS